MGNCILKPTVKHKRRNKSSSSIFTRNPDILRSSISVFVSRHSIAVDDGTVEDLERVELEQEAVARCDTAQQLCSFPSVSSNVVAGCKSLAQRSVLELPPTMASLSKGREKEHKHHVNRRATEVRPMVTIPEQGVRRLVAHLGEDAAERERYPSFLNPYTNNPSVTCPTAPDENAPHPAVSVEFTTPVD